MTIMDAAKEAVDYIEAQRHLTCPGIVLEGGRKSGSEPLPVSMASIPDQSPLTAQDGGKIALVRVMFSRLNQEPAGLTIAVIQKRLLASMDADTMGRIEAAISRINGEQPGRLRYAILLLASGRKASDAADGIPPAIRAIATGRLDFQSPDGAAFTICRSEAQARAVAFPTTRQTLRNTAPHTSRQEPDVNRRNAPRQTQPASTYDPPSWVDEAPLPDEWVEQAQMEARESHDAWASSSGRRSGKRQWPDSPPSGFVISGRAFGHLVSRSYRNKGGWVISWVHNCQKVTVTEGAKPGDVFPIPFWKEARHAEALAFARDNNLSVAGLTS